MTQTARARDGWRSTPRQPGAHRRAAGDAKDEDRHHRAERVGGGPQDRGQQPRPHHLQRQRREAGDAERGRRHTRAPGNRGHRRRARPCGPGRPRRRGRLVAGLASLAAGWVEIHQAPAAAARLSATPTQGGAPESEHGQQDEAGEERAGRGAQRVGGIQPTGVGRDRTGVPHHPSRGDRERGAHRGGGERQQQQARAHAHDGKREPAIAVVVERGEGRAQCRQEEGQQQRDRGNRRLEAGVGAEGGMRRQALPDPAACRGADGQAAHEGRQHRAGRGQSVTDLQRQQAGPDHFIDEGCRTGQREQHEERPATHPLRLAQRRRRAAGTA